jgi:hypothetical protein
MLSLDSSKSRRSSIGKAVRITTSPNGNSKKNILSPKLNSSCDSDHLNYDKISELSNNNDSNKSNDCTLFLNNNEFDSVFSPSSNRKRRKSNLGQNL